MLKEAILLLIVSVVVGTAGHTLRTDKKKKIAFVDSKKYPLALEVRRDDRPAGPESPGAISPTPSPTIEPAVKPTVKPTVNPPVNPTTTEPGPEAANNGASPVGSSPEDDGRVEEVLSKLAYTEAQDGGVIFVDARRTEKFEEGRIAGARSLAIWEADFEERLEMFLNTEDPGATVFVYCKGKKCEDSHQVALRLKQAGFINVRVIHDGYPGWKANGFPVASGPAEEEQ